MAASLLHLFPIEEKSNSTLDNVIQLIQLRYIVIYCNNEVINIWTCI